ncbi:hypothetical protein AVEN_10759-1 [Araneus ventricosus]|uniref:Uncharacterized protein n=1 Tax=Araneus ventricosus TaxID=182803 RepID=A0A4Y2BDQ1_ARAVE|nr:hypothetical protein AVEN_10759-1 [Araneus ventricosus]
MPSQSPEKTEMISDLESNDPPIPMTGLYHKAIGVAIQPETISNLESVIPRFPRRDSFTRPSQSPDKQRRYRIWIQRSSDSNDTTLSPCPRRSQTNRCDRFYSGTHCWVRRRHFFRTFIKGKVTSTNPTGDTRIAPISDLESAILRF